MELCSGWKKRVSSGQLPLPTQIPGPEPALPGTARAGCQRSLPCLKFYFQTTDFSAFCSLGLASTSKWECRSQISCGLRMYPILYWWVTRWQNALKVTPCAYLNYSLPRSHALPSTNLEDQVAIPRWASGCPSQLHDFCFAFCKEQAGLRSGALVWKRLLSLTISSSHTSLAPLMARHYQSNMSKRF